MEPLVKPFSLITKFYHGVLSEKLKEIPIKRYYYIIMFMGEKSGPVTLKELASSLHIDKVSITRAVNYLGSKGTVVKNANINDQRSVHVSLTPVGITCFREIKNAYKEIDRLCLRRIHDKEKEDFVKNLTVVMNQLENSPRKKIKYGFKRLGKL
jgi:DNA-binding MarR family transcriptional regulator